MHNPAGSARQTLTSGVFCAPAEERPRRSLLFSVKAHSSVGRLRGRWSSLVVIWFHTFWETCMTWQFFSKRRPPRVTPAAQRFRYRPKLDGLEERTLLTVHFFTVDPTQ